MAKSFDVLVEHDLGIAWIFAHPSGISYAPNYSVGRVSLVLKRGGKGERGRERNGNGKGNGRGKGRGFQDLRNRPIAIVTSITKTHRASI